MVERLEIPNCDYKLRIRALGSESYIVSYQIIVEQEVRASNPNVVEFRACHTFEQMCATRNQLLAKYTDMHKSKYEKLKTLITFEDHRKIPDRTIDDED